MDKVFALQRWSQQAGNGSAHQQLKGRIWDEQAALHTPTVLDGCPDVLI